jgi:hypothetical protein
MSSRRQLQLTFVQACEKYCVERADPSWTIAVDSIWGATLPSMPLVLQAHDSARDSVDSAPKSAVPPPAAGVGGAYFRSVNSAFVRVLGGSGGTSMRTGIRAPFSLGLVDAPADLYADVAPAMSSSAWRRLRLENEADYSHAGSETVRSLPSLKESGLLHCGEGGSLPAPPVFGLMAGQLQQPVSSPATQSSTSILQIHSASGECSLPEVRQVFCRHDRV